MTAITVSPGMCVAASDAASKLGIALPASQADEIIKAALSVAPTSAGMPVNWTPPKEAWAGLARDIVMWLDLTQDRTPRSLLQHLGRAGTEVPQWLRDEPEMQHLDNALSKGTRAVIIYRAMSQDCLAAHSTSPAVPTIDVDLLQYVLQDDLNNRLTPRVVDIAYTAFTAAKAPNPEDGGPSDWFTDTKPRVEKLIAKLRSELLPPVPAPATAYEEALTAEAALSEALLYLPDANCTSPAVAAWHRRYAPVIKAAAEAHSRRHVLSTPQPVSPEAPEDEREFQGQIVAMLKQMFDAPTMAAGYAILADFAAQFYPGQPAALKVSTQELTETAKRMAYTWSDTKWPGNMIASQDEFWNSLEEGHRTAWLAAARAAAAQENSTAVGQGDRSSEPVRCSECGWLGDVTELGAEGECGGEGCPGTAVREISTPADMIDAWQDSEGQICGPQLAEAGLIAPHPATNDEAKRLDLEPGDSVWDLTDSGKAVLSSARGQGGSDGL